MYKIFMFLLFFVSLLSSEIRSLEKGYLIVALKYDRNPMSFLNKNGQLDGIEVKLMNKISDILNVRIKYVELNENEAKNSLLTNKIDIIIDSSIKSLENDNNILYSKSYFYDKQVILLRKKSKLDINSDFENINIGSLKDSIFLDDFLKIKPNSKLVLFSELFQLKKALEYKNVDGILLDYELANYFVINSNNSLKILDINLSKHPYKMAFNKDNFELKNRIDDILNRL